MDKQKTDVLMPDYSDGFPPRYSTASAPVAENAQVRIYKIPNRVIPVIFLPGVMGSNLRQESNKASIWKVDSISTLLDWAFIGADVRKKLLDPTITEVDPSGKVTTESAEERAIFKSRVSRGWGEVGARSYGTFLPWLQEALNDHDTLIKNRITGSGEKTLREQLISGVARSAVADCTLSHDEAGLSYKYLFPLHAVGYNWLQSNKDSAQRLQQQVDKIIRDYNRAGLKCEKVILVTHSMGGLVARYYSELLGGKEKILGIVHGVMPDQGSPMAYKRMKTGEAGTTGWVIGANGAEMTPVLAQSPGPLQLLPGTRYGTGWLQIDGMPQSLPRQDPYGEIYLERAAWWGLCEERFLNPENKKQDKALLDKDWKNYFVLIKETVQPFIEGLYGHYHKQTYAFYGNDGEKYPTYASLHWRDSSFRNDITSHGEENTDKGIISYPPEFYNETVRLAVFTPAHGKRYNRSFRLLPPQDAGDGTVPVTAAVINSPGLRSQIGLSVDHEKAYEVMDSRYYTLWAIIKIAQRIKETGLAYAD